MKRFLYIFSVVAMLFVGGCTQGLNDISTPSEVGEGEVLLSLNLKIQNAETHTVNTRAVPAKENVTAIDGYALVFGNEQGRDTYGDNSELLQKVAFKTVDSKVYITLKEQTEACFICLVTSTSGIESITNYADYKALTVDLSGYYASVDSPDPADLTDNSAFPLASPFIDMPNGLTEATVAELNKVIDMVPPAAKVDVTSKCNFELTYVTLLNGAKESYMSNEVWENGTVVESMDIPFNLGGETIQYANVAAKGNTTADTPIYLFPNDGDADGSDAIQGKNPTYLIIEGKAAGYSAGYYKIPIKYNVGGKTTYDIVRNNYYKVNLKSVNVAGYKTFDAAVAGPANDIAFDIIIGGGNTSNTDTFTDPRAETIVSHNGFFHIELVGSEIYAQGYGTKGVKGNIGLSFTANQTAIDAGYTIPNLEATVGYGNIEITSNASVSPGFAGTIGFTANGDGSIKLRCGDMEKVILVHYRETPHVYGSGTTIGGQTLGGISEYAADADASEYTYTKSVNLIDADGNVSENDTYKNREFRGKAYPNLMSRGIYKVYVAQASNFDLNTYYDNRSAGAGGDSGTNNIFSDPEVSGLTTTYTTHINYQSTGKVYQLNSVLNGTYDSGRVMNTWKIGKAEISFKVKGEFDTECDGALSNRFTTYDWSTITDGSTVTIKADNIGNGEELQSDPNNFNEDEAKINNNTTLTLKNIAGQEKVYKLTVEQSAAPYIASDDNLSFDKTTGIYLWECPEVADCHNIKNPIATTPKVYNAHYSGGGIAWDPKNENSNYWLWTEAPTEDSYTGGSSGLTSVSKGVSVVANPDGNKDAYVYDFKVNVNEYQDDYWWFGNHEGKNPTDEAKKQAYFDLRLLNDAGELIILRLRLRRQDNQ